MVRTRAATVAKRPSLRISCTGEATAGAALGYTLTVLNAADSAPPPSTITLTDVLPAGLSFVSLVGAGWSCLAAGQTVLCSRSRLLGRTHSALTLTVVVAAAAYPGVTNTAATFSRGKRTQRTR